MRPHRNLTASLSDLVNLHFFDVGFALLPVFAVLQVYSLIGGKLTHNVFFFPEWSFAAIIIYALSLRHLYKTRSNRVADPWVTVSLFLIIFTTVTLAFIESDEQLESHDQEEALSTIRQLVEHAPRPPTDVDWDVFKNTLLNKTATFKDPNKWKLEILQMVFFVLSFPFLLLSTWPKPTDPNALENATLTIADIDPSDKA